MADPFDRIYLDFNATAPVLPDVVQAVTNALGKTGNPSSIHRHGRLVRSLVDEAREHVAQLINADPTAITFTSGGTEANALAILGCLGSGAVTRVIGTTIEHPSVLAHVPERDQIGVTPEGIIDLEALEHALNASDRLALVCVMFANNETGVIQPIEAVSDIAHQHGSFVLCDAVQAPGKAALQADILGADFITLSGHKIGGPQGVGALVNVAGIEVSPVMTGGGQERRLRSGTENVPGIVGFGEAAKNINLHDEADSLRDLQSQFENALLEARPEAQIHGHAGPRLPNTTCVSLPGVSSQSQVIKLDLSGFSISAGSACSSGKVERSHVLEAMGVEQELLNSAIRISFGRQTRWDELDSFVAAWAAL